MNIEIQKAKDRGATKTTWLDSRHSFSFGNYYNPNRMGLGTLHVLNDDIIEPGAGFPTHPHENMEIVTIILEGSLEHKDSMGSHGIIHEGEVQRMSAGTGVTHSEFNHSQKNPVHLLQIWVYPKQEDIKPSYEQKKFYLEKNKLHYIVSQVHNEALHINQDASFLIATIECSSVSYKPKSHNGVYIFVIKGEIELEKKKLEAGDAAEITDSTSIEVRSEKESKVLMIEVPMGMSF